MPLHSKQKIIIHQPWGGLGDNLQFSTLPELFAARGIQTFISSANVVRNPEIDKLVWAGNPFVIGSSEDIPNAGACMTDDQSRFPLSLSFIERIELAHGLDATNRFPKIYYRAKSRAEFFNTVVVDVGSISVKHYTDCIKKYIEFTFDKYHYKYSDSVQIQFSKPVGADRVDHRIPELTSLVVDNIFEYCDILKSCRALVTVHSGTHSLAAAIRRDRLKPIIHCYCTPEQFNGRGYIFDNVEYFVTQGPPPDSDSRVQELLNSTSWRITAPLRRVSSFARKLWSIDTTEF
jgi:hypothetical protein